MIKACIFDLDGTLLNTLETIKHYVNATTRELGLSPIGTDECRSFIGHGAYNLIKRTLESKGINGSEALVEGTLRAFNVKYNSDTLYLTEPYDGIVEAVEALCASGIRLAVLSNKPDSAVTDIISRFFPGRFAVVHGGRDGVPLKPDPAALLSTIDELGVLPSEVVYVGDSGVDVITGKGAGVYKTVGVSWGYRAISELRECGADVIIDHPMDLVREAVQND